jgi:hypothetical protein
MQQLLLSIGFSNKHVSMAAIVYSNRGMVFSVQSMPRNYKQDSWINELLVKQSPASKNVSTEAEGIVGIRHQATTSEDIAN